MFLNLIMLAGLGGAAVPLVLHLLGRARYRSVDWGAMMFLPDSNVRQRQSTRLKQLVLLLVRMAIVALLAVALARPIVRGSWAAMGEDSRVTAVIVVDCSASMNFQAEGRSRMEMARDVVLRILEHLRRGDRVALVLAGAPQREPDVPTSDLQQVAQRVEELKCSAGQADMAAALVRAADVLERYEKLNREIYVICDRQASNWRDINESFQNVWRHRMGQSPAPLRFAVIPVGGEEADNVAIESMELLNPPAIAGRPMDLEIRVRNYGTVPRAAMPLTLHAANRELLNTTVSLLPGATATVRAAATYNEVGSHVLSATVRSEGQTSDDTFNFAVDVVEPVRVLVLSGDHRSGAFQGESDYLRLALTPFSSIKRHGKDMAKVDVVPAEKWADVELDRYDVVVLANVPEIGDEQVRAIEQYAWGGGGLLVAPGNLCRVERYNESLYRDGSGILPAKLQPATPGDGSAATSLLGIDLNHTVFRFLKGKPDPIPSATIGRHFPVTPRQPDARVLASYISGDPFVIDGAWGRGRVLLVTTPLDADWSTLPLSTFYLPFAQSMVRYLAAGNAPERNLAAAETIHAILEDLPEDRKVTLVDPEGRSHSLDAIREGRQAEVDYGDTDQPGTYRLRYRTARGDQTIHYVVRALLGESDLTPLTAERMQNLRTMLGFELVEADERGIAAMFESPRAGRELWLSLLGVVMTLALAEMAMARMWSRED